MYRQESLKLSYEDFREAVLQYVKKSFQENSQGEILPEVSIQPVMRNNEMQRDALSIHFPQKLIDPVLYLSDFYRDYQKGKDLKMVLQDILDTYQKSRDQSFLLQPDDLYHLDLVKDRLILRLTNRERNRDFLQTCPHREIVDLLLTYRILTSRSEGGLATVSVTNELMGELGLVEEELFTFSTKNMPRLFPPVLQDMKSFLLQDRDRRFQGLQGGQMNQKESTESLEKQEKFMEPELYVCTNDCGFYGASALCYPHLLEAFAQHIEGNFYILPCSVHEVIFLSTRTRLALLDLEEMVARINQTILAPEEFLSDSVYFYSQTDATIRKCSR